MVEIVRDIYRSGAPCTVVFSAFSGVTDTLLSLAKRAAEGDSYEEDFEILCRKHTETVSALLGLSPPRALLEKLDDNHQELARLLSGASLLREASARTIDHVASMGERDSALIISYALAAAGIPAQYLDARTLIETDARFGAARVNFEVSNAAIEAHYRSHTDVQVVTGFIGCTSDGHTTTLGRGGGDYTAAIVAAALQASVVEIWTDVDGVMTADPRRVPRAFSIPNMTYAEALEMSHFGAKVIYPPTILPALEKRIPLRIKNTFRPEHPGTLISHEKPLDNVAVRGVSSIPHVALLTLQGSGLVGVPGTAARLFAGLARHDVNVILITQGSSEHSITFAVTPDASAQAKSAVEEAFALELRAHLVEPIRVENDVAVVAIIGEGMRTRPGIAGRLFHALGRNGINTVAIAQGSSELNISVAIPKSEEKKAIAALHEAFFLSKTRELNVFLAGVGVVGGTLLKQIARTAETLRERRGVEVRVIGIANSKRVVFSEAGVALDQWQEKLVQGETCDAAAFVKKMRATHLPNSIFIDCTASDQVPLFYEEILDANISISTCNKSAMSGSLARYQNLRALAERRGVFLGYETNVGAGLPVLTTLNDLVASGDRIVRLEGVLSGSMSYVFNSWQEGTRFSDLIRGAKELGYTEPDPRLDLTGADVAKKLLILARECGLALEKSDIVIDTFLPAAILNEPSVDSFLAALEGHNSALEDKRRTAESKHSVLRLVATIDGETQSAGIAVREYAQEHPFAGLRGSENMIVFTTERYQDRPLVVRGPGAGAEVTAAGVFAEILRIGNSFFFDRSSS